METRDVRSEAGLTLLEVMFATIIFVVACSAMVTGLVMSGAAQNNCDERYLAIEAVLSIADEIRATPIDSAVAVWGSGGSRGNTFEIPGISANTGSGTITLVTDETRTDAQLGFALGMPRDLNGDGAADTTNIVGSAMMLPVIIEATWGPDGARESFRIPIVLVR